MDANSSQSAFLYPILIPLKHSKGLFGLVAMMHALCALMLLLFALSIPTWPLWIILVSSAIWNGRVFQLNYFPLEAVAILLTSENEWFVVNQDNETLIASERQGSFVHPLMVLLRLRCQKKNLSIILTHDNLQEDVLRRLRVRLRYPVKNSQNVDQDDLNLR